MTDYVAIALIGVWIFKDNFASTFKLIYEGTRHHVIIFSSLYLYWIQMEDLHVNFFKAILSHISCAIMIFQESICLWDVPLNTQKTAANVYQGTLIWVMGLLVNWSMATPGAGAGNRRKSIRVMILISFPIISMDLKGGGRTTTLSTLPVPQSTCVLQCKEKNTAASKTRSYSNVF